MRKLIAQWYVLEALIVSNTGLPLLALHFIAGLLIGMPLQLCFGLLWLSALTGVLVGAAKEAMDGLSGKGGVSAESAEVTALGSVIGAGIIYTLVLLFKAHA